MSEVLAEAERGKALEGLDGFTRVSDRSGILRIFRFARFSQAFFMTRVAMTAERADYHPKWFNVWNPSRSFSPRTAPVGRP